MLIKDTEVGSFLNSTVWLPAGQKTIQQRLVMRPDKPLEDFGMLFDIMKHQLEFQYTLLTVKYV